ncbi:TonB-dependent receptor domain-containing protein [Pseudopontixanthobacter vadosimaris]|uniref:TonB-dependent receptor domain-containing protein n=1 Tax=Pseudopontixanthobacter vadosimaris TaxID=2726450 RepID=UPI001474C942|nr:TonB-dependent receptor [Pseudopontixanthobacter vadosimaris]
MIKNLNITAKGALFTGAGLAALALATPASAQDTAVASPPVDCPDFNDNGICDPAETLSNVDTAAEQPNTIVVTGSRIARPNLEAQVPVTILTGEEFFEQGSISVGDTLNDLPQLRSSFSQANAGRFLGTTGLNLLDLRGLGTARTLTLVNGRRHVASDILSNGTSVDVNTIPTDLIERVEVVTGGNSAIYGSDAIAGVVNFILRDNYEGVQFRGHASVNEEGTFPSQYISVLAGQNFADGRGNITLHGEYANQERVYGSDVGFLRRNDGFLTIDTDSGTNPDGSPLSSDGFPDRAFFRNISTASIFFNGLVPITRGTNSPECGTGLNSVPFNCTFLFTSDGQLVPQTGTRLGTGPIGSIINSNGQTGREGTLLSVFPQQERYNANLLAHFELAEAFEPFIEAKYVRINTQGQQSSPAFVQGVTFGDRRELVRLDNPFLNPAARNLIAGEILESGFNSSLVRRNPLTDANRAAIADGSYRFTIARSLTDLGNRDEASERDVYRIVGGVRGQFNDDWSYEVSANYGRVDESTTILGNIIPQRFLLALDSGIDPATGQIRCRSQFDPTAAVEYGLEGDAAALADDIANCVPYNPFGAPNNAAAADYILENTVSDARLEQLVISGFVSGDSSGFFNLPGGPIGFAVGAEYRREELFYQADPIVESGRTFYNALPTFAPDPFEVKEAFGEIRLPLLADRPFFNELTVSGSGRVSDYEGEVGTVYAYNAGVEWSPIRDIRFRAQYGRSVRAPNLTETSFPITQNFAPGFSDPCLPQNINNSPNRAANCRADLGNLLTNPQFVALPTYSLEILSGSNPNLTEETSDSYTIGAVLQPRFLPGFSFTADYYDISVDDVITAVSAQTLVDTCYDLPSLDNPFCALINRFRGPGTGPNDEVPGQILDQNLVVSGVNFAARTVRGIDLEAAYSRPFGADNAISTRFIYTHLFERSNFESPTDPDFEDVVLEELGDPQDEFRWNVDLKLNRFTLGYEMRYIGPMYLNEFEDFNSVNGDPPANADYADIRKYSETFYHDVRVGYEVNDQFDFDFGVDNVLDTNPPLGLTGIGGGSGIYRIKGRTFYAGVRAGF